MTMVRKAAWPLLAVAALALSACENAPIDKRTQGQILGGVTGAAVGSAFGAGSGQALAIGAGAVLGTIAGGNIGERM